MVQPSLVKLVRITLRRRVVLRLLGCRFRGNFVAFDQDGCSAVCTIEPGNVANVHFRERHGLSAIRAGDSLCRFQEAGGHKHIMTESRYLVGPDSRTTWAGGRTGRAHSGLRNLFRIVKLGTEEPGSLPP